MSFIFRDPYTERARQEEYARKVDEAMRTGKPYPSPPPVDGATMAFERTIQRSDVVSKNMMSCPAGPPLGPEDKEAQLPERPAPLNQSFPSRSSFATGANTQPFSLGAKGGK